MRKCESKKRGHFGLHLVRNLGLRPRSQKSNSLAGEGQERLKKREKQHGGAWNQTPWMPHSGVGASNLDEQKHRHSFFTLWAL
jgi:hypothetical protein